MVLRAPVEVQEFHLRHEDGDVVLTIATATERVRIVNPYPLDTAWSLFMDDPGVVEIADVRSRQLESYAYEISTVSAEGVDVRFLARFAGPVAAP